MRKFLNAAVLIPLGIIFVVFAVANRHDVTVSFDPFNSRDPALGFTQPLYMVIITSLIVGVLAGGFATWFRQRRWRRSARQLEADARDLRAQLADWRATAMAKPNPSAALPEGAYRRDKHGATL